MLDLLAAIGLALVIEGAAYALFPTQMKRLVAMVVTRPENVVRNSGLVAALVGLMLVLLARSLP